MRLINVPKQILYYFERQAGFEKIIRVVVPPLTTSRIKFCQNRTEREDEKDCEAVSSLVRIFLIVHLFGIPCKYRKAQL